MMKKQIKIQDLEPQKSLYKLADSLIFNTNKLLHKAKTEEDLRIGFEKLLEPLLKELGVKPTPRYEKSIFNSGRSDALHGQVVIEYEPPFSFKSPRSINHAYSQLVSYIQGLSKSEKETLFIFESKFIGVGFDGKRIFFVRYRGSKELPKLELEEKDFVLLGPYEFNEQSARTLLTHLRALARLPLNADNLAQKFGPASELASKAVSAFVDALENWGDQTRVRTFYNEWKRLFGIVYGDQFNGQQDRGLRTLMALYKVGKETDFQELLFSVHTYFAFLMKLIAAELLTLKETAFHSSFTFKLAHISEDNLKHKLEDIENGGIYSRRGITNFLEGDFFRWYLSAWSPRLIEALQEIARGLADFEPATTTIDPNIARDLLKKLYQYLVPQEVRHHLGEYYTPDWLAELVLNEIKYDGNVDDRVLDPACGSGTFLVLAIRKAKEQGLKDKLRPLDIVNKIISNIWGFDLNPLAVIAARTNYLFALGDLANELSNLEIPVYLADSVLWPQQVTGQKELNFIGNDYIKVKTSIREFHIPADWVKDNGILIRQAAPLIEQYIKKGFEIKIAIKKFSSKGLATSSNRKIVEEFYSELSELEKQNKNGIWARFLKNAFAPMIAGKFDFVVGNPPWIRWGYLSKEYREATLPLWKDYGLFPKSQDFASRSLGGGEKDFSMLFTYASADYYLKSKAKLGFLITQEVFKSKGAGEGFRKFRLGEKGDKLKVYKAHDLVSVQPFEGASNKTAAIFIKKGQETSYPLPYFIWNRKRRVGKIQTDSLLEEVLPLLEKNKLIANPIRENNSAWQTVLPNQTRLSRIGGINAYVARVGARVEPYGVFWLGINQVLSNGNVIVRNLVEEGKKEIQKIEETIENDLIYPAVRGSDVSRWIANPKIYVLITHVFGSRKPIDATEMKDKYPHTYGYLLRFKEDLLNRALYKKMYSESKNPFYTQFNVLEETFSAYKVAWKRMANDIIASVITQYKTPFGYKIIIPTDTTSLFAAKSESEAHYLCAILNSQSVREFIKSYSSAGRGFGTPSVMTHVGISRFDNNNPLHHKLAECSIMCHKLKSEGKEEEVRKTEDEISELTNKLFSI